ncbi:MAG: radical SAM protein [Parasporobacterium sp.]|nr:radical SAM protein [Parasporobacterium sp.]
MKYILNNIALRSFIYVPYAYYVWHERNASGLSEEEFNLLLKCNGEEDLNESGLLKSLLERGLIRPAKDGEKLSSWAAHKNCDNRYFPAMNLQLTSKCNFNCIHCFNAEDNARLSDEWSYEDVCSLLDQARDCGINALTISGGEPMIHPRFMDVVRKIYENDMFIEELNTNGVFLTQEILTEFKRIGCNPLMKISFDGVGTHDILRCREGAEKKALESIQLCLDNGFRVMAQTNVNAITLGGIKEAAMLLDSMGVQEMRIIRTTETPRWAENEGNKAFSFVDYYNFGLEFLEEYLKGNHRMNIIIWQVCDLDMQSRAYSLVPASCDAEHYRGSIPLCKGNRGMVAIGANGNLYPCLQLSGTYDQRGEFRGNVKQNPLQGYLKDSEYLTEVCRTVSEYIDNNTQCGNCQWFKMCLGGCRGVGWGFTGDMLGPDFMKCVFFNSGYYEKYTELFESREKPFKAYARYAI